MIKMKCCDERDERGTKKKSECLTGFEPMTSQIPVGRSNQLNYEETPGGLGHLLGSYVTRVLLTARISNVEIVMCMINNSEQEAPSSLYSRAGTNKFSLG